MVRIVCWNINRSPEAWTKLCEMDDVDVALLQEVGKTAARHIADSIGERVAWDWNRSEPMARRGSAVTTASRSMYSPPVALGCGDITQEHDRGQ